MSFILRAENQERIGRYEIIGELGTGGMSKVYLCVDNHIGKKWAIKRIALPDKNLRLIESEINMLKALDYYMFPRIVDAFKEGEYYYIVTDYIEGTSLDKILKTRQVLPESTVVRYVNDLAGALKYLHCQSPPILYLDMKPSNIMVKKDGSIMLIDFGIAQSIIEDSKCLGTRGYAAPEQYLKGSRLLKNTDVFALGMTIYSMLTGRKPDGNYEWAVIEIKNNRVLSKRMKDLILKCIQYDPQDRCDLEYVISTMKHWKNKEKGLRIAISAALVAALVFCISIRIAADAEAKTMEKSVNRQMAMEISKHIDNGEYTKEGVRIICGYLDGNFLDEETEEYFTYEVAKNLFEVQRDYREAKRYFDRLDSDKYPEVKYLLRICNSMSSFEKDRELKTCLDEFIRYNEGVTDSTKRNENKKLIAVVTKLVNEMK